MKQKTAGERIRALRGGMSQADFGQLLDSSQGAVSAWERDDQDRSPSATIYFRLAGLARDPEDVTFFLGQAGLDQNAVISVADTLLKKGDVKMDAILATAEEKLKERVGDPGELQDEGKLVIIPQFPEHVSAAQGALPLIAVPAVLVPHRASTFYIAVQPRTPFHPVGPGLAAGDIVVFDSFGEPGRNLQNYFGEELLARVLHGDEWSGEFALGRLGIVAEGPKNHIVLGPLDVPSSNWRHAWEAVRAQFFAEVAESDPPAHKGHRLTGKYRILGKFIARFSTGGPSEYVKQEPRQYYR